jgi:hypothetical protein
MSGSSPQLSCDVTPLQRNNESDTLPAMTPKQPVLDLFIGRDGDGWRLRVAPQSWFPVLLSDRADANHEPSSG